MNVCAVAAAAAMARAAQLRSRVGTVARILAVIGLQTPSVKAAAEAVRTAVQIEREAKDVRLEYRDNLGWADRSGAIEADRRQRQQEAWEDRADVRAARHEEAGNRMVAAAVKDGDRDIQAALWKEDGLQVAREMIAMREVEWLAKIQRQQQLQDQRTSAAASVATANSAPELRF